MDYFKEKESLLNRYRIDLLSLQLAVEKELEEIRLMKASAVVSGTILSLCDQLSEVNSKIRFLDHLQLSNDSEARRYSKPRFAISFDNGTGRREWASTLKDTPAKAWEASGMSPDDDLRRPQLETIL